MNRGERAKEILKSFHQDGKNNPKATSMWFISLDSPNACPGNKQFKKDLLKIADYVELEIKSANKELVRKIKNLIQEYRLFYTAEFMKSFNKIIKESKTNDK